MLFYVKEEPNKYYNVIVRTWNEGDDLSSGTWSPDISQDIFDDMKDGDTVSLDDLYAIKDYLVENMDKEYDLTIVDEKGMIY